MIIQKGEQKLLMYYWFQQRERRSANEFTMKYYLLLDSLTKNSEGRRARSNLHANHCWRSERCRRGG